MAEINLAALLGGVGLFLLGMTMMSGGLKLSLGPALTRRLRDWTNGRLRGLLFGSVATALMQSSTATTVATIGFVNAGLLPLGQSLWVIFGANLGSMLASRHAGIHVERAAAWAENRVGGARPAAESPAHVAPRRKIINRARKRRTVTAGA